jgi:hypothetical protein
MVGPHGRNKKLKLYYPALEAVFFMTDIKSLYEKGMAPLQVEMLVEGPVIEIKKSAIYIDLQTISEQVSFLVVNS